MPLPVIISTVFGSLLFGLFYLINRRWNFDYVYGLYGLALVVVFIFALIFFTEQNNPFIGVGIYIVLVLASFAFLGYVLTWVLVKQVLKK